MAIHIDIYAHLRDRELIKEGEKILQLIRHYEDTANRRAVTGAQARTKKIGALNDKLAANFDQSLNSIDDFTEGMRRLERAEAAVEAIGSRVADTEEDQRKKADDLASATREVARAKQDLIYKGQALTKAINNETRTTADLRDENAKHTKNLREVTRVTNVNRKELTQLSRTTNNLRRQTENLHSANITIFQDNKKITKQMEDLGTATKRTTRAREKYNETRKKDGVKGSEIKAAGRVLKDALEAEARKARDVSDVLVETIQHRQDHDNAVNRNSASLNALAVNTGKVLQESERLRATHGAVIDQNSSLARTFDRVDEATKKAYREYAKYDKMSRDTSVSGAALQTQFERTSDAFETHAKTVHHARKSLEDYYASVDEAERKQALKRKRELIGKQSIGQYISRNIGALTPLGTVSPGALVPLVGILGAVAEGAVTASQGLALLPAGAAAAAAGIGTLVVGMHGFGAALTGMGDPKKFAEALYLLSPNAQQAALHIKQLVDGPLGDLKRATQDALFADVGVTIQKLTQTLGPAMQRMTTSIAGAFNHMFTGISFDMMTPEMSARLGAITSNIAGMFDRMVPGVRALNDAFMKIAYTGSKLFPGMGSAFTNLMNKFDAFVTKAMQDGSLQKFMQKGIDAIAAISKWLLKFGQDIYKVFGDKSPEEFMKTLDSLESLVTGLFGIFSGFATVLETLAPAFTAAADAVGGWENAIWGLLGVWAVFKAVKMAKFAKEIADAFDLFGSAAAKAGGSSMASAAAGARAGSAATTGAFAAAGASAGKGFGGKFWGVISKLGWVGLGLYIGKEITEALDKSLDEWKSRQFPNPQGYLNEVQAQKDRNFLPEWTGPFAWFEGLIRNLATGTPGPGHDPKGPSFTPSPPAPPSHDSFYKDWYPQGANPAQALPGGGIGPDGLPLPNVPLDENGKALTDSEILNQIRSGLPRASYSVDPFTDPITGQKLNPMLPIGPNGMPEYPAGGVPGTPSIKGPIMPQYNSFGQLTGYGANMVDPEAVFDAQLAVQDRARGVEEAQKDLLAGQQSNLLTAEEINDLERKVLDAKLQLHKSLVQLGNAQTGDVEKLKKSTDSARNALDDLGTSIDKDFGISKGLAGIAENLTKFLASLAFAPAYGAMRGAQAALGFPGGEGTGHGLAGAFAVSQGYYKGGPMDTGAQPGPGYAPGYTPSAAVGPQAGGVGFGSGPGTSRADIKGINLSTIPVAAQQYANNCIDAAAQIILSANGVQLTQDQIEKTIARGGSIDSLAAGLNKLDPSGGYVPIPASGGSPEALLKAVQDSINKGNGSVLNVSPGSSIGGRNFPAGHFIAVTGYDPNTGRINLSDTANGSMYSVTAGEAFQSSQGRGLVAGLGLPAPAGPPQGPVYGPPLPRYAAGGEVPIMAHSGEHVLTREDVAALGGQAGVYNFRRSLHSYQSGGAIPLTPFSPDPFDPSNIPDPFGSSNPKDVVSPTDLGSLLGVGGASAASTSKFPATLVPGVPPVPAAPAPVTPPPVSEVPAVPAPSLPTIPETVLPPGVQTPGTVIGAQVDPPAGYGSGFQFTGGGIVGLAGQALAMAASSGAGAAGMMAGAGGGGSGGGAASAIASLGIETGIKLAEKGIEYGAQVAGIATQGVLETFLPAGGSELASNNWLTRIVGGVVGAAPAMANLAGGANQSTLPGVGAPTPEQIAAQGMDPNRTEHTGTGAPAGPYTGVHIENYVVAQSEDRAGQDIARYQPAPGAR